MKEQPLSVYFAGKLAGTAQDGLDDWRDRFAQTLSEKTGRRIFNLDPTKADPGFERDEGNAELIFGRECFMISRADLVVVNLSDDISVGGSQEMLIAKYFAKPLVGIAKRGGKFVQKEVDILGKRYTNHIHPFVKMTCDAVVEDMNGVAEYVLRTHGRRRVRSISIIRDALEQYERTFFARDTFTHSLPPQRVLAFAQKGCILNEQKTCMLIIQYKKSSRVSEKVRGRFGLPGGRMSFGESIHHSLVRQVEEETGIRAQPALPLHMWSWRFARFHTEYQIVAAARVGYYRSGELRPPLVRDETDLDQAKWIPLNTLSPADFIADERPVLHQLHTYLRTTKQTVEP